MYGLRPFGALGYAIPADPADAISIIVGRSSFTGGGSYSVYVATREFISGADDTPARQPFDGTLDTPLRFSRSINGDGFSGFIQGSGEMSINNTDGTYDFLPQYYALDGRDQEVRLGVEGEPYSDWVTIFKGTASDFHVDEDSFRIDLQDYGYKLDVPLQERTYLGTGGIEGGDDLAGKRKPLAYGYCGNVTPVLVSASAQLYQVHDGPVEDIPAVYANAAALTAGSDHADATALLAASISDGYFHTCLAEGLFRIDFLLDGDVITADVEGDASGDEGFVATVAGIIRKIAFPLLEDASVDPIYNVLAVDTDTEEDVPLVYTDGDGVEHFLTVEDPVYPSSGLYEPGFAAHAAAYPYEVGHYFPQDDTSSVADALAQIAGFGSFVGFTRAGKLTIGLVRAAEGPPIMRFDRADIVDIRREKLPAGLSPPAWRWKVGYARNWRVQDSEVAGSVSDARRAFLAEEVRFAVVESDTVRSDHPFAGEREVGGYFRDQADAEAEGERLADLFSRSTSLYRITVDARGFGVDIGDVISVTYPRWDLASGRELLVVEMTESAGEVQGDSRSSETIEIVGWG